MTETRFIARELPPDRLDLDGSFADTHEVTVMFDASVQYRLIEDYGFLSFTETEDGHLLFSIGYTNSDYILGWILGFGQQGPRPGPRRTWRRSIAGSPKISSPVMSRHDIQLSCSCCMIILFQY